MFFGNKSLQDKIDLLEREVHELRKELSQKDKELERINEIEKNNSSKIESLEKNNQKSIQLFKEIAAFSQEEGLVVFDEKNNLFFTKVFCDTISKLSQLTISSSSVFTNLHA